MKKLDYQTPVTGQLQQLADDLYWARFDLPFRLTHVNLYILDGPDGWIILDTGINDGPTRAHWQALLEGPLKGRPVAQIIVSHYHPDHVGFAGQLSGMTGAPVASSQTEAAEATHFWHLDEQASADLLGKVYQQYGLDDRHIQFAQKGGSRYRMIVGEPPKFDILAPGYEIKTRAGSWQLRMDRGHSDQHISLMERSRGLYLSVDFLLPRITPNIAADIREVDADRLTSYLDYLAEMCDLPDEVEVFPGHDWPFAEAGKRAAYLIAHHQQRLDLLNEAARKAPLSTAAAMAVLFGNSDFGDHELYFASGEARAHLNHLVTTGQLMRQTDADGTDWFVS